jgi:hypothetical protein
MTRIVMSRRHLLRAGACALTGAVSLPALASTSALGEQNLTNEEIIRRWYAAWVNKDLDTFNSLLADDFTFSSAAGDDHISKSAFKTKCWDTQVEFVERSDLERITTGSDDAFVKYAFENYEKTNYFQRLRFAMEAPEQSRTLTPMGWRRDSRLASSASDRRFAFLLRVTRELASGSACCQQRSRELCRRLCSPYQAGESQHSDVVILPKRTAAFVANSRNTSISARIRLHQRLQTGAGSERRFLSSHSARILSATGLILDRIGARISS